MPGKNEILSKLRSISVPESPLPGLDGPWITFTDPVVQFQSVLESVGGRFLMVPSDGNLTRGDSIASLGEILGAWEPWRDARKRVSLSRYSLSDPTIDLTSVDEPHHLEDVDIVLLDGGIAVAENAAVWIDDRTMKHRVLPFITQHLILIVHRENLVHNMHEAYARLGKIESCFGCWVSGPSKTADIEQSLVVGAHGARSMLALFVS